MGEMGLIYATRHAMGCVRVCVYYICVFRITLNQYMRYMRECICPKNESQLGLIKFGCYARDDESLSSPLFHADERRQLFVSSPVCVCVCVQNTAHFYSIHV